MELADSDLYGILQIKGSINEEELHWIMVDVLNGLEYLHKLGVAHRDIKPQNILLFGPAYDPILSNAKLTDYSLVREANDETVSHSYVGTRAYMAPELHLMTPVSDVFKLDIWSLGITMYECLVGRSLDWNPALAAAASLQLQNLSPFTEEYKKMYQQVKDCDKSREVIDLMCEMLELVAAHRYSLNDVDNHPWIRGRELAETSGEESDGSHEQRSGIPWSHSPSSDWSGGQ